MAGIGSLVAFLSVNSKKWNQGFAKASQSAKKFGSNYKRQASTLKKTNDGITKQFAAMRTQMLATFGGVALIAGIGATIKKFVEFEKSSSKLQAILGVSKKEMGGLTEQAKKLGSTSAFTASAVVELQTELAKLGFTSTQIEQSTSAILDLAAASGSELAQAAKQVGAAIRAFELDASAAGRVADVFAEATASSALNMEFLDTAMSKVAPVARAFGFSIEESTALLGTLADAGFDASTAATSTRSILLNLSDANGQLAKELGRPIKSMKDLIPALRELDAKGVNLNDTLKLTDKRSVAAFQTFLKGSESLETLTGKLENAEGAAQGMADTMLDNVAGDITKAKSAWEGLVLSIEDGEGAISAALRKVVQATTQILQNIQKLNKTNLQNLKDEAESVAEESLNAITAGAAKADKKLAFLQKELSARFKDSITSVKVLKDAYGGLSGSQDEINKAFENSREKAKGFNIEVGRTGENLKKARDEFDKNRSTIKSLILVNEEVKKGVKELIKEEKILEQVEKLRGKSIEVLTLNMKIWGGIVGEASRRLIEETAAADKATEGTVKLTSGINETAAAAKKAAAAAKKLTEEAVKAAEAVEKLIKEGEVAFELEEQLKEAREEVNKLFSEIKKETLKIGVEVSFAKASDLKLLETKDVEIRFTETGIEDTALRFWDTVRGQNWADLGKKFAKVAGAILQNVFGQLPAAPGQAVATAEAGLATAEAGGDESQIAAAQATLDQAQVAAQEAGELATQSGQAFSTAMDFASGNVAGGISGLVSIFGESSEAFQRIITMVNETIGVVMEKLAPIFEALLEAVEPIIDVLLALLVPLTDLFLGILEPLLPIIKVFGELIAALLTPLQPLIEVLTTILVPVFKVLGFVLGLVAKVIVAVVNVIIGIVNAFKKSDKKIDKVASPKLPQLAAGGIVTSPTIAEIGEGGKPEAIIPLDRLGEFGGGGTLTSRVAGEDLVFVLDRVNTRRGVNG